VINVVGGVVVLAVSAVVPLVVARAALSLMISLMSPGKTAETAAPVRPEPAVSSEPAVAH